MINQRQLEPVSFCITLYFVSVLESSLPLDYRPARTITELYPCHCRWRGVKNMDMI